LPDVADILSEIESSITFVESDSLSVSQVYPQIERLANQFKMWNDIAQTELRQNLLQQFIVGMKKYFFCSTNNLFAFAYACIPRGRNRISDELHNVMQS
jgi:hypothetical protein